jgi:hypothetical protein
MVFAGAMAATAFTLYHCAGLAPAESKYRGIIATAIAQQMEVVNPLCKEVSQVRDFPHVAPLARPAGGLTFVGSAGAYAPAADPAAPLRPEDPLGLKWADLVRVGLVHEFAHYDHELRHDGFRYELTEKGRRLYSPRTLKDGATRARFCLGRPALREIQSIAKPTYSVAGLDVRARYVLEVKPVAPELYDGTAEALGITVPRRQASGELLFEPADGVFTLERGTDKVLYME